MNLPLLRGWLCANKNRNTTVRGPTAKMPSFGAGSCSLWSCWRSPLQPWPGNTWKAFLFRCAPRRSVVVLAVLLAAYAYDRKREVSALHSILHDLRERAVTPSDEQLDQLGQMIARSQRSFKELIDSFEDAAFAISLDGTVRTGEQQGQRLEVWVAVSMPPTSSATELLTSSTNPVAMSWSRS